MAQQGDGLDEVVEGIGRSAIMAGGQVLERRARAREAEQRDAADRARQQAADDRARAAALRDVDRVPAGRDDVTALAVLRADDRNIAHEAADRDPVERERRNRLRESMGLDPVVAEAADAVDVAARSQARPPVEAVAAAPAAGTGRPRRGRGRGAERERGR